ncbi:MAG: chloride channel protein, partial [Planctomycetota bacterium]
MPSGDAQLGLRQRFMDLMDRVGIARDWAPIGIGAAIGSLTGLGAVGFERALHWFEHAVERGHDALGDRGFGLFGLVLFPAIGMGLTGVLVHLFAAEAKGHGVPQVIRAILTRGGVISPRVGVVKTAASILTVGSGGSAGTEGPIVQIGATIGSWAGKTLRLSREQMGTLVGCGAAAGISSIFNAPIAGVFFVMEILLRDFSIKTFTPIVVASVFSSATTQAILQQNEAIFAPPEAVRDYVFSIAELPSFVLLGVVCGLVAAGFNRLLHAGEDFFESWKAHPLVKPLVGAGLLGLIGIAWVLLSKTPEGLPPFFGNGYATIRDLLDPASAFYGDRAGTGALGLLVLLVVVKGVATTLTLASGGSGGVFAPSLFMGATAGASVGLLISEVGLLASGASPAAYALVGMAAVVAASTHAPLTAILILFELTRDIYVLLPIMIAAVISTVVAQVIDRDSVYTFKLRRAGVAVGAAKDLTILRRIPISSVDWTPLPPEPVYAGDPVSKLIRLHADHTVPDFPVVDADGDY